MPHNAEDVITFAMAEHARQHDEIERLGDENAQLRTMIAIMLRTLKQVEICLQIALDREKK